MDSNTDNDVAKDNTNRTDYAQDMLPPEVVEKLEAGAFRQLCRHLQERSDEVQNMDLMTLSGFCRNCLAKWMVLEARTLVDDASTAAVLDSATVQVLNAMGYEEAAQHVYGTSYGEWKARHQKKATDEQLERYKASSELHAQHDKNILAVRAEKPTVTTATPSNVCCQEVELVAKDAAPKAATTSKPAKHTRTLPPYQAAPLPSQGMELNVAVLTVSDRASKGEYETGDLSGPAVEEALQSIVKNQQEENTIQLSIVQRAIVPDDKEAIQSQLQSWCNTSDNNNTIHMIFTTGGTGLGPRDVTPEATQAVLTTPCPGLMSFVLAECSKVQPLATLSRGTAGLCHSTIIANLPGNPKGVHEIMPLLLPLLLHACGHVQM